MSQDGPLRFLLVEDEPLVALACQRVLVQHGAITVVGTVGEALLAIASVAYAGIITDVSLPDGSGLEVARLARARLPRVRILVVSGEVERDRLKAAQEIGAAYLLKPIEAQQLRLFAKRSIAQHLRIEDLIVEWTAQFGLTPIEAATLRLAIDGLRREEIARHRGVSEDTVKRQISGLLKKVGATTLVEATNLLLFELVVPG